MSQVKMKKSEYLVSRGWCPGESGDGWIDPTYFGTPIPDPNTGTEMSVEMSTEYAVTIQQARDEVELRAAWISFATGAIAGRGIDEPSIADRLLNEYRARFIPSSKTEPYNENPGRLLQRVGQAVRGRGGRGRQCATLARSR